MTMDNPNNPPAEIEKDLFGAPLVQVPKPAKRSTSTKGTILELDPLECRIWQHNPRQLAYLNEANTQSLVDSILSSGGQQVAAVGRLCQSGEHKYEVIVGARRHWSVCCRDFSGSFMKNAQSSSIPLVDPDLLRSLPAGHFFGHLPGGTKVKGRVLMMPLDKPERYVPELHGVSDTASAIETRPTPHRETHAHLRTKSVALDPDPTMPPERDVSPLSWRQCLRLHYPRMKA